MIARLRAFGSGLHFRFMMLVIGMAVALLAAQLVTDTASEIRKARDQRIADALSVTSIIARSLEKQFDMLEHPDIEAILANVRAREDVLQLTVVDRELTFFLDGDPRTSPISSFNFSTVQIDALKSGKTTHEVTDTRIKVGEPLMSEGGPIGSVSIEFRNPDIIETMGPIIGSKLATAIPILVTGILFAVGLVSQITSPLRRLSAVARAVSDGTLDQTVEVKGALEIRQLGEAFNSMIATLKGNIDQIYKLA